MTKALPLQAMPGLRRVRASGSGKEGVQVGPQSAHSAASALKRGSRADQAFEFKPLASHRPSDVT